MKKIFNISAWLLAFIYLVLVLGFVENKYEDVVCKGIEVWVHDSLENQFVDGEDIRKLIMQDHPGLVGAALSKLNTGQIEGLLLGEKAVKNAQVYKTVDGLLVVEITQRIPVIRVQDRDHQDFYLDSKGFVIPPVGSYAPHMLMANGYIDGRYRKMQNVLSEEDQDPKAGTMKGLLDLASFIDRDPFWKSQIVQIYLNNKEEFELIPRVGSHIILFGTSEQIEDKFSKLWALYNEGFSQKGWNQYEIINLKYDKQVICTKR